MCAVLQVHDIVMAHAAAIDAEIDYSRDFDFDYFGFKTLERSYLLRIGSRVIERPQHMVRLQQSLHAYSMHGNACYI